jgi:hypothetical protein
MRLCHEGAGQGARLVSRALCDDCTPSQFWIAACLVLGFVAVAVFGLVWYFESSRPSPAGSDIEPQPLKRNVDSQPQKKNKKPDAP